MSPPPCPLPGDSAGVGHGACSGAYFIAENRGVRTKRLQMETELDLLTVKWMHLTYKIRCRFFQKNSLLTGSTGGISKYEGRNATPSGGGSPSPLSSHTCPAASRTTALDQPLAPADSARPSEDPFRPGHAESLFPSAAVTGTRTPVT